MTRTLRPSAKWRCPAPLTASLLVAVGGSLFGALSIGAAILHAADPVLRTPAGPLAARWQGFDEGGKFLFLVDGQPRAVGRDEFFAWGAPADMVAGQVVALADGGLLAARRVRAVGSDLLVQSELWGEGADLGALGVVRLPRERVRGVVLRLPGSRAERDKLIDLVATARYNDDRLLLANGDWLAGNFVPDPPPRGGLLPGQAGPAAVPASPPPLPVDEPLALEIRGERVAVPAANAVAVVFNAAQVARPAPRAGGTWLGLSDGSRLLAERVVATGPAPGVQLEGGVTLEASPLVDLRDETLYLRPVAPGTTFLSDLEPAGYRHWPYLGLAWPYQRDRNVLGGWLRHGERVIDKGLGLHSRSRLLYQVPPNARRLEAELALDAAAGAGGSVVFRVYTLGAAGTWQTPYESPPVRGGDPPLRLSLDMTGVRQVALLVEFGERGDQQDYANWLWARFEP